MKTIDINLNQNHLLPWVNMLKDTEENLEITVFDGDDPVKVTDAKLTAQKPFGERVDLQSKIKNGIIVADVTPKVTDQTGKLVCEIETKEKSAYFLIYVEDIR